MTIAIIGSQALMPAPFQSGLNLWSQTDGTAGSPTWSGASNAAIVPADEDFGACLEILKQQAVTSVRYMRRTPMNPGNYLRISTRVKAIAGNLPQVRIAAYAANASGNNIAGVTQVGPVVTLPGYGQVAEVSAIVGSGRRDGVDMAWGRDAAFGYFGIDLIGDNFGSIRIENIVIEDVTAAFLPGMLDWVDVRDFGAVGNGVTDDRGAFIAANAAAGGGEVLVPEGTYYIDNATTEVKTINVFFAEKCEEDGKPVFFVHQTEYFPRSWAETAVECFIKRLQDGGQRAVDMGMSIEAIAAKDKEPEGIVQVRE